MLPKIHTEKSNISIQTILKYIFLLTTFFHYATLFHTGLNYLTLIQCVFRSSRRMKIQNGMFKCPSHFRSSTNQSSLVLFKSNNDGYDDSQTDSSDKKKKQTLGNEVSVASV